MNSGMMGNSSGSGNSSVDDNLESDMSDGEDEPLSDLEKYEVSDGAEAGRTSVHGRWCRSGEGYADLGRKQ